MSKRQQTTDDRAAGAPAATEPPGGWPADEFTGVGGCYVRDPVTGKRRPEEPAATQPAAGDAAEASK